MLANSSSLNRHPSSALCSKNGPHENLGANNTLAYCRFSIWRHHFPKLELNNPSEVLVSSDVKSSSDLTFYNISARQDFCYRGCFNFQVLHCLTLFRIDQKSGYHSRFANWTVLAIEEVLLSVLLHSRVIIFRFSGKTQWQMFLRL